MPVADETLREVLMVVSAYVGTPPSALDVDAKIGSELGLSGGDSVEFLDQIEFKFGIELEPLVRRYQRLERPSWIARLFGFPPAYSTDFSIRQLVGFLNEGHGRNPG
jgi:hypothetical protein